MKVDDRCGVLTDVPGQMCVSQRVGVRSWEER